MALPFGSEQLIERSSHLWKQIEGSSEANLLKIAILRDLYRALHARKSQCLAKGAKEDARALNAWEARLTELKSAAQLSGELIDLIQSAEPVKKRTRLLPESLFSIVPREKLERYDRAWELSLAAEGFALGWKLWSLKAWVEIPSIERWNSMLSEQLWPNALVLFVESAGFIESGDPDRALWQGDWLLLANPRIETGSDFSLDFGSFPGRSLAAPSDSAEPSWKLVFAPKKRL